MDFIREGVAHMSNILLLLPTLPQPTLCPSELSTITCWPVDFSPLPPVPSTAKFRLLKPLHPIVTQPLPRQLDSASCVDHFISRHVSTPVLIRNLTGLAPDRFSGVFPVRSLADTHLRPTALVIHSSAGRPFVFHKHTPSSIVPSFHLSWARTLVTASIHLTEAAQVWRAGVDPSERHPAPNKPSPRPVTQ